MPSVFEGWISEIPMQQQSVLVLALRGPDGIRKHHPCKDVLRAYRASVLKAAYYGRSLRWGEKADNFMSMDLIAVDEAWNLAVKAFFDHIDEIPHHAYLHFVHGAQILGVHHPDARIARRWHEFYLRCCANMSMNPETRDEMMRRLGDWDRVHWDGDASAVVDFGGGGESA